MNFVQQIQQIAIQAVRATQPMSFVVGTVVGVEPLQIKLDDNDAIVIEGEAIVLTSAVVERKVTVQKHTHDIGKDVATHTHGASGLTTQDTPPTGPPVTVPVNGDTSTPNELKTNTKVVDTVISAVCNEHGDDLDVESDDEKIVFTINRALRKDDKVVMLSVDCGQTYIVLSRAFMEKEAGE